MTSGKAITKPVDWYEIVKEQEKEILELEKQLAETKHKYEQLRKQYEKAGAKLLAELGCMS